MASPEQLSTPEKGESAFELVAPPGWQKKMSSAKRGGTPSRVYFVTPDGEEIKSKRALDQYLKKHPGGPASSEFDWGTGETPTRRSSRLSSKPQPSPTSVGGGSGRKRVKKAVEEVGKDEEIAEIGEPAPTEQPSPNKLETHEVPEEKAKEVMEEENPPVAPLQDESSIPFPVETVDVGTQRVVDEPKEPQEAESKELHGVDASADVTNMGAFKEDEKRADIEVMPTEEKTANEAPQDDDKHDNVQNSGVPHVMGAFKEDEKRADIEVMPTEEKAANEAPQDDDKHDNVQNSGAPHVMEEIPKKEECDKTSSGYQQCPEVQNSRLAPVGVST